MSTVALTEDTFEDTVTRPGITLIDLFAFLTENLLYRSNRMPEANRLKFLSMLGISLEPPSPGVGMVTEADRGALAASSWMPPVAAGSRPAVVVSIATRPAAKVALPGPGSGIQTSGGRSSLRWSRRRLRFRH